MFIGSINRYMRCVLESAASQWRGQDIYVACSGNFTVERILSSLRDGVGRIFSNDVSIYSCALGWHPAPKVFPEPPIRVSKTPQTASSPVWRQQIRRARFTMPSQRPARRRR